MKILAIAGSIREKSYNLALLKSLVNIADKDINIQLFKNLKDIPVFYPPAENTVSNDAEVPQPVKHLIAELQSSDGVIISTAEYAHGIPGVLKNALDWLVSTDALVLKPVMVTSVSTSELGGVRSHGPLVLVLSAMNASVVVEASLNIPFAHNKFDNEGKLQDPLSEKALYASLSFLQRSITEK